MPPFYGLSPNAKIEIHKGIFNMVTFGKGTWSYEAVYNMPVFLRNFYMAEMAKALEKMYGKKTQTHPPVQARESKKTLAHTGL